MKTNKVCVENSELMMDVDEHNSCSSIGSDVPSTISWRTKVGAFNKAL